MGTPLILIDGSSWLFRAYHGLPPLTNAHGEPTGAVFGMTNMLKKLLKEHDPQRICVVFDAPGKTFRDDIYPEYKATRSPTPEELKAQFPVVEKLITALGLKILRVPKVEADDVIGTLTREARKKDLPVLIVTADKDLAQLVDEHVRLLDTMKNRTMDVAGVEEKFGVPPERIIEYLALVGDSSDNIPGVPLWGPKKSAQWLNKFGSLEELLKHADEIPGKTGENFRAAIETIPMSLDLVTIRCDLELDATIDDLTPGEPDKQTLAELFERLGFNKWLRELGEDASGAPAPAPEKHAPKNDGPTPARKNDDGTDTVAETVTDDRSLTAMLKELENASLVCVDTETDSLDPMQASLVGLSFSVDPGHGWYVPLLHNYLGAPKQLETKKVLEKLKPVLEDPKKAKLGQHIKYDINVLARHGIEMQGIAFDTMLESYVLDAVGSRHDMDTLAARHLGHTTIKFEEVAGKGKSQVTFDQVPIERATEYAAEDADITLRLHEALLPKLDETPNLRKVFDEIEMPLVPVLARVERNGVLVDDKLLGKISSEFTKRMEELQEEAWEAAGTEFNLASPPQLQQILYEKMELPVLGKTPKGQPSTAEDVLESLASEEHGAHALPRIILQWRGLSKLRSTYTDSLPKRINKDTGRIHTSYHQAVAATGRLSSADPNLQNIPIRNEAGRRIRQAFIAPKGRMLLAIDYSQIELRLMAHLSGDKLLQQAFKAGLDVHRATAAEVFGLPLDDVDAEKRRAAKAINFGLIYGMSAFGLARQLGIARREAAAYMENFFARYPGVKAFMDETKEKAREEGYVETLFGRRLYLPNIRSKNAAQRGYAERTAINAPLQGTAADLIKLAMIDLDAFISTKAEDVLMIMQVHDELVFEGPAKRMGELAQPLAERMCLIKKLNVPLVADWGLGHHWDDAHSAQGHARSPD